MLRTVIAPAQLAEEPTARNSKRLPVKANGEVRLRSVLSINNSGICGIPAILKPLLPLNTISLAPSLLTILSNISDNWRPKNTEMIAGGASLAPKRCALVALIMLAFNKPLCLYTAIMTLTKKVMNCRLSFGVLPGESKLTPVSVPKDQLQCFPEPLTPLKGFSCKRARKQCLRHTRLMVDIKSRLWSFAKLASSYTGANSN